MSRERPRPPGEGGAGTSGSGSRPDRTVGVLEATCRLRAIHDLSTGYCPPELTDAERFWAIAGLAEWASLHLAVIVEHDEAA